MTDNSITRFAEICAFYQRESARRYAAAMWEMENGGLSRVAFQQEVAAVDAFEARLRLFQLIGADFLLSVA